MFPFRDSRGELNGYKRLKFDQPRKDRNGKAIKYESPCGQPNRVYVPPGTVEVLSEPKTELIITEGEKKALCADQFGFPCLGLVGVFGWKTKAETLLLDLERVEWNGRKGIVCFDSDLSDKPEIKDAETRLAAQLKMRGATVKVARLPDGPNGEKVGIDDFIVTSGHVAFRKILEAAEDPEPVDSGSIKVPASQLDPMIEARQFLAKLTTANKERKLHFWNGSFWLYEKNRYRELSHDEIRSALYKFSDPFVSHLTRSVIGNIQSAVEALSQLQSNVEQPSWLNGKRKRQNCVAVQKGILDIDVYLSGLLDCMLPHSPNWFSPVCLPFNYDVDADFPEWSKFLKRNLDGDQDRSDLLQEWFGYHLAPLVRMQEFMLMEGEGSNGKSVVSAVLGGKLGSENVSHTPMELFGSKFSFYATLGNSQISARKSKSSIRLPKRH
jgi:hypothetical protein